MNTPLSIDFRAMVMSDHGEPMTTSYAVAEAFDKRHSDVLRAIKNMRCSEGFTKRNFALRYEISELQNRKPQKYYQMTERGFMFLVMGFSGVKADAIKESFIDAFEWMAKQINESGFALAKRYNYLTLKYQHSQQIASACGKGLQSWKVDKKPLESEIESLKNKLQGQLPFDQPSTEIVHDNHQP